MELSGSRNRAPAQQRRTWGRERPSPRDVLCSSGTCPSSRPAPAHVAALPLQAGRELTPQERLPFKCDSWVCGPRQDANQDWPPAGRAGGKAGQKARGGSDPEGTSEPWFRPRPRPEPVSPQPRKSRQPWFPNRLFLPTGRWGSLGAGTCCRRGLGLMGWGGGALRRRWSRSSPRWPRSCRSS